MQERAPSSGPSSGIPAQGRLRVRLAAAALTMALAALTGRLAQIQFADPDQYTRLAAVHHRSEPPATRRGSIYDRKGNLLAVSVPSWSVFADPSEVKSPLETARILSRVLEADMERIHARMRRPDRRFVWIKRQVSESRAEWVRALGLKGIHMRKEYQRVHPSGSLCAHVVGFTDIDGRGLEGVEARFDGELGKGQDIYLTIDGYIQTLTRNALMRQVERHEPEAAWALVLDAGSGEILSMVNWPQYDPRVPAASPPSHRRNRVLVDTYEYGSVMKPVTVAIALERGLIEPETEYDCHRGAWRFGRRTIRDVREHGLLTVSDIIARSSNIGVAQIGLELGEEHFWEGLRRFGFGERTGVELSGEKIGIMRPASRWNDHSLISIAFGQEISTNALALARAYLALANEGVLIRPSLISRVTDPHAKEVFASPRAGDGEVRRAVSERTARQVIAMLGRVVEEGTGTRAAVEGYRVGGKTGTGSLMCAESPGYSRERYISTFVGFAPLEDPRIVVLVSLKVPTQGGYYGGTVAGPAFREITRNTLGYLNVPPDTPMDFIARAAANVGSEYNR